MWYRTSPLIRSERIRSCCYCRWCERGSSWHRAPLLIRSENPYPWLPAVARCERGRSYLCSSGQRTRTCGYLKLQGVSEEARGIEHLCWSGQITSTCGYLQLQGVAEEGRGNRVPLFNRSENPYLWLPEAARCGRGRSWYTCRALPLQGARCGRGRSWYTCRALPLMWQARIRSCCYCSNKVLWVWIGQKAIQSLWYTDRTPC